MLTLRDRHSHAEILATFELTPGSNSSPQLVEVGTGRALSRDELVSFDPVGSTPDEERIAFGWYQTLPAATPQAANLLALLRQSALIVELLVGELTEAPAVNVEYRGKLLDAARRLLADVREVGP